VALIDDPIARVWRTSTRDAEGNLIYAMLFNDITKPSRDDVLIGSMDSSELADSVVDMHNRLLKKFGRHYPKALSVDD
jgi:hypothetical protein